MKKIDTPKINYIDLFAGAGGLSEGFTRAGFIPLVHVEMDKAACFTLKTRAAFHYLEKTGNFNLYIDYLNNKINRKEFYSKIPSQILDCVINEEITDDSIGDIFKKIDMIKNTKNIDLIVGGPPCQAYSVIGRSRDVNGMKNDKRNYLYKYYVRFLKEYNPKYFVFENVKGLLSAKDIDGSSFFDKMQSAFCDIGYSVEVHVLNANEYGVPQNRNRVILIGKKGNYTDFYPWPEKWNPKITVKDVIEDLPKIQAGKGNYGPCQLESKYNKYLLDSKIRDTKFPVTEHIARPNNKQDLEIYRIAVKQWNEKKMRLEYGQLPKRLQTHHNKKSFTDRFKVVAGDLNACHTVVAHAAKDGHYYIHPDIEQNRSLTPRELARLQTFPDNYYFESMSGVPARTPIFKQIGNAVPVILAERVANKLKEKW